MWSKTFLFTGVNTEDIKKEIFKLIENKSSYVLDIPVIKDNDDIFADFKNPFKSSLFPNG